MNGRILLLPPLLAASVAHAQNWSPFPLGQQSYFHITSDTGLAVVSQVMDSIKPDGTNSILYFQRKQGPDSLNACFRQALANSPLPPLSESNYPMDSMVVQGDTAYWFPAPGDGNCYFLPRASVGQSWTVPPVPTPGGQQTTFTCISAQPETFLGITDSVKTFSINTSGTGAPPINTLQIKLSKAHGLIAYLPFVLTVPHSAWLPVKTYSLIGADDGTSTLGWTEPTFSDYFHLSAGDLLQWEETYVPLWITWPSWTLYQQDSITSAMITPDSVVYHFQRTTMDTSLAITQVIPDLSSSFRLDQLRHLAWAPTDQYGLGTYDTNLDFATGIPVWQTGKINLLVDPDSGDTITTRSFSSEAYTLDPGFCGIGGASDLIYSFTLDSRTGISGHCTELTSTPDCWNMIGWRIDGVVTGDIKMAEGTTGIREPGHAAITIVPNPAHDRLQVHGLTATGIRYAVLDPTGRELLSGRLLDGTIPLGGISAGAYLVRLTSGSRVQGFRFVKE